MINLLVDASSVVMGYYGGTKLKKEDLPADFVPGKYKYVDNSFKLNQNFIEKDIDLSSISKNKSLKEIVMQDSQTIALLQQIVMAQNRQILQLQDKGAN